MNTASSSDLQLGAASGRALGGGGAEGRAVATGGRGRGQGWAGLWPRGGANAGGLRGPGLRAGQGSAEGSGKRGPSPGHWGGGVVPGPPSPLTLGPEHVHRS